jgi:hypothetical protein
MNGASTELGVHSDTLGAIARKFIESRDAAKHCPAWRSRKKGTSDGFRSTHPRGFGSIRVVVLGRKYRLWLSRAIPNDAKIKTACLGEDARGQRNRGTGSEGWSDNRHRPRPERPRDVL